MKSKKNLIILAIVLLLVAAILWVGRLYILNQIKTRLEEQLYSLRDSGYIVKYDSINVNTKESSIAIYKLSITRALDSTICSSTDFFSASLIKGEGFKLLPLLIRKRLSFNLIEIDSPKFFVDDNFSSQPKKDENENGTELSLSIDKVKLLGLNLSYIDSTSCSPNITYTSNATIEDFALSFYKDRPPFYNVSSIATDGISVVLSRNLYTINIKQAKLDLAMGTFDADTIRIIPHYNKVMFGKKLEQEIDRFEGVIPYLNLYGLSVYREDSVAISVDKMTTQLFLKVYRDKRHPFKNDYRALPNEVLSKLAIGLNIDSLVLNKSYVEYEEYAAEADSAGRIFFDDIYASLKNINNTGKEKKGNITMNATSLFMGQGEIKVNGTFPHNPKKKSKIKGSIQHLDFKKLNAMIEPLVKIRAESGHLNKLSFSFTYDNDLSQGELELNYIDLHLVTFRQEEKIEKIKERKSRKKKKGKHDDDEDRIMKDPLKTFVLNVIVRKNMDGDTPEEKKIGEISFERNKRRSVFNFWAKSMFSGIKSAYNIDKFEDSRLKKLLDKKE
jgi:hypothetical protein